MKNLLKTLSLGLLMAPTLLFAQEEGTYEVKGTAPKNISKVYLMYYDFWNENKVVDSAEVKGGKFNFTWDAEGASYGGLLFRKELRDEQSAVIPDFWFYINPGETVVDASGSKAQIISGGKATQDYLAHQKQLAKLREPFKTPEFMAYEEKIKGLEEQIEKLKEERDQKFGKWDDTYSQNQVAYIKAHPNSSLSLLFLEDMMDVDNMDQEFRDLYASLNSTLKDTPRGKKVLSTINAANLVVGVNAVDFEQPDANGKMVKLSDFKGKYLLVDFWASWCVPCRKENPFVVKAYETYKSKNFEILGVSLDDSKENWLKAIKDDGLTWTNVSDLKGWKNEASRLYGVSAVPTNILISPEGKIIAKDLRGEDLERFLQENL